MNRITAFIKNIKFVRSLRLFFKAVNAGTYYPERPGKPYWQKLYDNFLWSIEYREPNLGYCPYGLDIICSKSKDFLSEKTLYRTRDLMNGKRWNSKNRLRRDQTVLLEDKFIFYAFLKGLNMPMPHCFAVHINGELLFLAKDTYADLFQAGHKFFAKKTVSGQGKDVRCIENEEQFAERQKQWHHDKFILQEAILQHHLLNSINPNSVNTIRLVTLNDGENVKPLRAVLRCGTLRSGKVDNLHAGGVGVGINSHGDLMKYGYYVSGYGTKTNFHPDSGVIFEGIKIPFYEEAVEKALQLHKMLYDICSIGWDIAITEEGPVFIEGNVDWGLDVMQMCHGGIRKEWLELCQKRGIKIPK